MKEWREEKIEICKHCGGKGKKSKQISMDLNERVDCDLCLGTGRVLKRVLITYESYGGEA